MKTSISLLLFASISIAHAGDSSLPLDAGVRHSGPRETQADPVTARHANGFYTSIMGEPGYGTAIGPVWLELALGIRTERSDELSGMGKMKASGTANLHAAYEVLPGLALAAYASLPVTHRENGKTGGIELSSALHSSDEDNLTLSLGANFADQDYLQSSYGLSSQQAARTGRAKFTPRAGLYEAESNLTWERRVGKQAGVTGMLGANTLLRDAANSLITRRSTTPTGAVFTNYRY
jgi:outer membrane scaffolding protein for murein synthesis (MipA/OmpV family)